MSSTLELRTAVKKSVLGMYLAHPYPQWSRDERLGRLAFEICRYKFLGLDQFMPGARFIEVGCGTGMRSMLVAQHYGVKEFVGLDHSTASLEVAKRIAAEDSYTRFTPVEADLFQIPYPENSFDVVVSWGVLHHTHDPFEGLREMVRVCRPSGFIALFLYNKWNHWRHNMQKDKVSRLGGEDVEKRFEVAHRLYGTKRIEEMSPEEVAEFYDQYCHPRKSDHTYGETLSWFDQLGLTFWGSFPPLGLTDAVGYLQYRGLLASRFPIRVRSSRRLVEMASKLPPFDRRKPPYNRPHFLQRFFWQAALAWTGRHGEYSGGSAFSARKPATSKGAR